MPNSKANFSNIRERIIDLLRNKRTQLPTLPVVAQNIIKVSRDPDTSATDLASFIEQDQAIANKVLRMANSSYYGMGKKVDSVLRAITIIGFEEIIGLAVGIGILPSLKTSRIGKILDMRQLWLHSLACCFAARLLVSMVSGKTAGKQPSAKLEGKNIFLPTLLHDMGKVLFSIYFPDEYCVVLEKAMQKEVSLSAAEQELLGMDHANFAAQLMEYWNFPSNIISPVRYHHAPDKSDDMFFESCILYLANAMARKVHIGNSYNAQLYMPEKIATELGLEMNDIRSCQHSLGQQRTEIEQFLELIS